MAEINITLDTNKKTMAVTINGTAVDKVRDIYATRGMDFNGKEVVEFRASTYEEDENKDVKKITHIMAKESPSGEKAVKAGAVTHPNFPELCVSEGNTKAVEDAIEFLTAYRKR